jgi:glyoxylase-like metal-dependent hydrolase (beta-lactamase superfamily II)
MSVGASDAEAMARALAGVGARVVVRGWLSANNVVFGGGGEGGAVVDTGYLTHAAQTEALVANALGGEPLARIVNTHLHSDHCGGNAALLRRWPGASLCAPAGYRDRLEPWDESRLSYRLTGQRCEQFRPDDYVDQGDTMELAGHAWEVHAAPGHDPDAVILYQPDAGVLISGDALWEDKLAIIFPALAGEDGFDAALRALDAIERLAPRVVIPGHGQPFVDVAAALKSSRQRVEAFAAAPQRHRRHSARALVVYHMLEHRSRPRQALLEWMVATPIFRQALQCEDNNELAIAAAADTVDSLIADRILIAAGPTVQLPPP